MKPGRALLDAAVALRAVAQWIEGHPSATWSDVEAAAERVRKAADALLDARHAIESERPRGPVVALHSLGADARCGRPFTARAGGGDAA